MDFFNIKELLIKLCGAFGASGAEDGIRKALIEIFSGHKCVTDRFGNLSVELFAKEKNMPVIMLTAHMDQISFIVSEVDNNGTVKLKAVGGVDRRTLYGADIVVQTKKGTVAAVITSGKNEVCSADPITAETGLSPEESGIAPGDRAIFKFAAKELGSDHTYLCCPALDNRAGCAALILAARDILPGRGVYLMFSAQEETGTRGGGPGAENIKPDAALVTDDSYGNAPGVHADKTGRMSGGPMIGISPVLDSALTDRLIRTAKERGIPFQYEVMGQNTGTDSEKVSAACGGVKTVMVSIPIRNMHTQCETVFYKDIENSAKLISAFINSFPGDEGTDERVD